MRLCTTVCDESKFRDIYGQLENIEMQEQKSNQSIHRTQSFLLPKTVFCTTDIWRRKRRRRRRRKGDKERVQEGRLT